MQNTAAPIAADAIAQLCDNFRAAGGYVPRHAVPLGSGIDWSAAERGRVYAQRAERAVVVLAATDALPASRRLYRELLIAGALSSSLRTVA